jgi:hypothetical protein
MALAAGFRGWLWAGIASVTLMLAGCGGTALDKMGWQRGAGSLGAFLVRTGDTPGLAVVPQPIRSSSVRAWLSFLDGGAVPSNSQVRQIDRAGFAQGAFEQLSSSAGGGYAWVLKFHTVREAAAFRATFDGMSRFTGGSRLTYFSVPDTSGAIGFAYSGRQESTSDSVVWTEGACLMRLGESSQRAVPVRTFSGTLATAAAKIYTRTRGHCATSLCGCEAKPVPGTATSTATAPMPTLPASLLGHYYVIGDVLSSYGFSGEPAGTQLYRDWWITRSCTRSGCRLILTRDLAGESDVAPISAVLHPTHGGWTASFVEVQGCPDPHSALTSTEYSTWKLWRTASGIQATEQGFSPPAPAHGPTVCSMSDIVVHWYATKAPTGRSSKV